MSVLKLSLPVKELIAGNAVLKTPLLYGKTTGLLIIKDTSPRLEVGSLGKFGYIHEITSV